MKTGNRMLLNLIVLFLFLLPNWAQARGGITFQGAMFIPSLKMISETSGSYSIGDYSGSFSEKVEAIGQNIRANSVGIGIHFKEPSGSGVRIAYQYRPESEMVYIRETVENNGYEHLEDERPRICCSLHMASLSVMRHITVVKPLDLYLGAGGAVIALEYPHKYLFKDYSYGFSGFPLIGVELLITSRIGLYGEYQYHFGRTLDDYYDASTKGGSISMNWYFSLTGPNMVGGVNLYF